MAKQLNIDMSIKADTSQAKRALTDLQRSLDTLATGKTGNKGFSKELQEGVKAASQLKSILASSTTSLGTLDLSKFTMSLQKSGTSLKEYQQKLGLLGTSGQQAFSKLATSISTAELPLRRTSGLVEQLGTTLKNTAKWQLSSSLLHGFMGAVQGAYRYAQNLDESLNNIRIRTGQSTEEMAQFAAQANNAAKALSTTTTAYTNAALIYYQQGLDDEQVKARTDITVKMANVTRDSAETVSQQLTAVWNNFDKGGEKLEYIADVMNALGAATASSTSEIATGLQKFAAAADAAGLSYEYAASALATITATTRQSADTVGTGLRTVLARIESLNLGETLEDGVGLTKYTKALESIGVQVLGTNGQLKAADEILEDMAAKWSTLTDAQKMATAETVGGIRQYTTIMALMENWDFMQENLEVARGSSGTLQEQADIYAESWEAARKRVKAAAEDIYGALIDEDFFIGIDNAIAKILGTIKTLIDGFGGVQGVIAALGTLALTVFDNQISGSIDRMFENMKLRSNTFRQSVIDMKREGIEAMAAPVDSTTTSGQISNAVMKEYSNIQVSAFEKQLGLKRQLTEEEQKQLQVLQEINTQTRDNVIEAGKELEKQENNLNNVIEKEKERIQLQQEYIEKNKVNVDQKNQSFYNDLSSGSTGSLKEITSVLMGDNTEEELNSYYDSIASKIGEIKREWVGLNDTLESGSKMNFQDFLNENYGNEAGSAIGKIEQIISKENVDKEKLYEALIKYETVTAKTFEDKSQELEKLGLNLEKIQQVVQQVSNTGSLEKMFGKFLPEIQKNEKALEKFKEQLNGLINIATRGGKIDLAEAFGAEGASAIKNFLNTGDIETFKKELESLKQTATQTEKELLNSFQSLEPKQLKEIISTYNELKEKYGEVNAAAMLFGQSGNQLNGSIDQMKAKISSLGQGITATARMVSSLGMAFNSIKGLANVWNDEDASALDKIITTMTTLSSVTMSLSFAFKAENIEKVKSIGTNLKAAISEWALGTAKKEEAKASVEGAVASGTKTSAEGAETVATNTLTAAIWKKVAAQMASHWYLLVIAAAIAALVAIIAIQIKKYNELTEAEKESAETAKAMADAYEKAKTAFDKLKQTIEDYQDAKEALSELHQGTEEWANTITSANEKANELLDTYSELRQYAHFNASTGLMEFLNPDGSELDLDGFIKQQQSKLNNAFQTKIMADTAHVQAESDLMVESFIRDSSHRDSSRQKDESGYQYGSRLNAESQLVTYGEESLEIALQHLAQNFSENGGNLEAAMNSLDDVDRNFIDAMGFFEDDLYELCSALDNNANYIDANTQQIANSLLENSQNRRESKNEDILTTALGNQLKTKTAEELEKLQSTGVTDAMREDYARAHGYNENHIDTKKGKNTFYDGQGEVVADSITNDLILEWQASQNAQQSIKRNINNTTEQVNSIVDEINAASGGDYEASQAVQEFLAGTRTDFNDLSADTVEKIKSTLYDTFTPEELEALGIADGTAFLKGYQDSLEDYNPYAELDKAVGGYTTLQGDKIQGGFEEFTVSNRGGFSQDELYNWYDSLNEEDQQFALRINFDSEQAKEDLNSILSELREEAASDKIATELELDEDNLQFADDMAEAFNEANEELAANEGMLINDSEAVSDAAVRFTKLNEAVEDLYDNYDKYEGVLKDVQKAQTKMDKALVLADEDAADFRKSLAKLVDTSEDFIDTNFIDAIDPDDLEKAAMGDEDAIGRIRDAFIDAQAAAEDMTDAVADGQDLQGFKDALADLDEGAVLDIDNFPFLQKLIESKLAAGASADEIEALLSGMGIDCDVTPYTQAMQEVIDSSTGAATVAQGAGDAIVGAMSMDATVNTVTADSSDTMEDTAYVETITPDTVTVTDQVLEGDAATTKPVQQSVTGFTKTVTPHPMVEQNKKEQTVNAVKLSNMHKSAGGGVSTNNKRTTSPKSGGKGGGGGGGGGSAPKQAKTQKVKTKKVERYKEITDKIEDLDKALKDTNTQSDRLWGKDRLTSMQKANDILKEQIGAYKEKAKQAENFLKIDREALQKTLKASWVGENETDSGIERITESFGNLEFKFDADGDISNYTEIMQKLTDTYNARQKYWANPNNFTDADAQARYQNLYVKPMEEQLGLIEEAIKQYEETKGVWEDNTEAAQEALREWQDNNLEQLEYKLELKVDVNESELEKIEYYIDKLSDDFYQMGENLANYMDKLDNTNDLINIYKNQIDELNKAYQAGDISQEGYYEALKDINGEMYDQLETLKELDTTMREYFGETLDMGQEELEKYTDNLDHVNDMLDHYKNVMQLLGKETDYEMIGSFLNGIAKNSMNNYLASKQYYDLLAVERSRLEDELSQLTVGTEEYKFKKQQLDDLVEAFNDAEDTMLDKAEEAAEAFKAVWENTIESIKHDFEMLVTGGLGYDFLNSSLDRLETRQDEYLTKTNQLYEMNDLLRKLQADSDKTTNLAAKQRIANFSAEMEQLRDKNELSKLDLDIAKARYQQLLAQIALEEAQNAKSMVRLHRDNEGNYGYMYTADPDKVGEAEDALAKANNDLYNIVLEGTNKYSQLSLELTQQYQDDLAQLNADAMENGWFETEEYYDKLAQLQQEYYNLSLAYAREYNTAYSWLDRLDVSTTGANEAYTQEYRGTILASQELSYWQDMADQMQAATRAAVDNINPLLEGPDSLSSSLGTVEQAVADNVERSNEWTEAVIGEGGLVNALGTEFDQVLDKTNEYLKNHQKALYETIDAYEELAEKIAGVIAAQSEMAEDGELTPEGLRSLAQEIYNSITFQGYDTGGYTGSWGSSGKLALLHEKELVLNKQDTENLLLSVDILRRLSSALDLQAMSSGLASISSSATINAGSNNLQQDVTIHAEFPNAVDHTEIEMAFDTLINRASQYAGR